MESLEDYIVERNSYAKKLDEAREQLQEKFVSLMQPILKKYNIKYITWAQYTPYFNDGDSCVFSSMHYDPVIITNEMSEEEIDELGVWETNVDSFPGLQDDLNKAFLQLNNDDMEKMFGDHVQVKLYFDHVETEVCDHE